MLGSRRREFRLLTTFCARIYYGLAPRTLLSSSLLLLPSLPSTPPLTLYGHDTYLPTWTRGQTCALRVHAYVYARAYACRRRDVLAQAFAHAAERHHYFMR